MFLPTGKTHWGLNMGGGIGGLLHLTQGGQNYAYLYDGKGNVTTLIDSAQAVAASYAYDPFGVLMKKTATLDQPYMFSTKEYDSRTGKYYYGFRFYDPITGKWTTRDPLGEAGGWNLYGFVMNSPTNLIDPFGLDSLTPPPPPGGIPSSPPGSVNPVLRCHVNAHRDPVENAIGATIIVGTVVVPFAAVATVNWLILNSDKWTPLLDDLADEILKSAQGQPGYESLIYKPSKAIADKSSENHCQRPVPCHRGN